MNTKKLLQKFMIIIINNIINTLNNIPVLMQMRYYNVYLHLKITKSILVRVVNLDNTWTEPAGDWTVLIGNINVTVAVIFVPRPSF